jgi:hypothetical protein
MGNTNAGVTLWISWAKSIVEIHSLPFSALPGSFNIRSGFPRRTRFLGKVVTWEKSQGLPIWVGVGKNQKQTHKAKGASGPGAQKNAW